MTEERFIEIMEGDNRNWEGDNAYQGLQILSKYTDNLVHGADHDIIYSASIDTLIEAGITEEDVIKLRDLNWMVEDEMYLACFV
jgi:hypothetical protein